MVDIIKSVIDSHKAQFTRHEIRSELIINPENVNPSLKVKMVEGMIVQIMENLLSNPSC